MNVEDSTLEVAEERRARYSDLLRYPEWRVFAHGCKEAGGFVCQLCPPERGRREASALQVHHWWYESDRWPWEYDRRDVVVLCASCHEGLHEQLEVWKRWAQAHWRESRVPFSVFQQLFRRFVFPGLTPAGFAALNGRLMLGAEVRADCVGGEVLKVLGAVNARKEWKG